MMDVIFLQEFNSWIVRTVCCSTLVTVFGCIFIAATRRHLAAQRHLLGVAVTCALLSTPIACTLLPGWSVLDSDEVETSDVELVTGSSAGASQFPFQRPLAPTHEYSFVPGFVAQERSAPIGPLDASRNAAGSNTANNWGMAIPLAVAEVLVLGIYALGVLTFIARLLAAHRRVDRWRRDATGKLPEATTDGLGELLTRQLRVDLTGNVTVPMVVGCLYSQIVLPASATRWHVDKLRAVVAHELAHIQRRDPLTNLLAQLAKCLYWPNPLVHWITRDMQRSQEAACDLRVVASGVDRLAYCRLLLEVAEGFAVSQITNQGVIAMSAMDLDRRITAMLRVEPLDEARPTIRTCMNTCCMLLLLCGTMLLDPSGPFVYGNLFAQDLATKETRTEDTAIASNQNGREVEAEEVDETSTTNTAADDEVTDVLSGEKNPSTGFVIKGCVLDTNGRPVPRSTAILSTWGEGEPLIQRYELKSSEFELTIPPLEKQLTRSSYMWFVAAGHGVRLITLPRLENADAESIKRFQLTERFSLSDLTVALPAIERTPVRVLLPDGSPCPNATVNAYHVSVPTGVTMANEPTGNAMLAPGELNSIVGCKTNANGEGSINGISRNLLRAVSVETKDYGKQIFQLRTDHGKTPHALELRETGKVRGKVAIDDPTMIIGTKVHLTTGSWQSITSHTVATIGANGEWEASIAAGPLRIAIMWNQELPVLPKIAAGPDLVVRASGTTQINITTEPAVKVRGRVLSLGTELPMRGAAVLLRDPDNAIEYRNIVRTDPDGFYVARVLAGRLLLNCEIADGSARMKYQNPSDAIHEIPRTSGLHNLKPLFAEQRPTITGQLIDDTGRPLSNRVVSVSGQDGYHTFGASTTDSEGRFAITPWYLLEQAENQWSIVVTPRQGTTPSARIPLRLLSDDKKNLVLQAIMK